VSRIVFVMKYGRFMSFPPFSPLIYRIKGCDTAKPHKFILFVGKRHEASQLFTKMQEEGIKPGMVCTYVV
jgi:hypothetical protein